MNVIFQISGGIGKCVMGTAVCQAIKKKYPDSNLIVVSGYPEVFLNDPNVHRSFGYGSISYFYEEYIENKDIKVFAHDPYVHTEHVKESQHCIKTWCEMFNLPYNGESPQIHLTERERTFFTNKFYSDKPILLLQPNGGAQTDIKYSWARDIPRSIVERVVEEFREDYNIIHIRREDQLEYPGIFSVHDSFRALVVLISLSEKRLLIDSFAQHVAASLGLPSTVCWIANSPKVFGYHIHDNILSNPFTVKPELKNSFYGKFNISGDPIEFPYNNENEIFNADKIVSSLKNQRNA